MGRYINNTSNGEPLPAKGKVAPLLQDGAVLLVGVPQTFEPNLVCVVDNGAFEAAAFCYDAVEHARFVGYDGDNRAKWWLIYEHADKLAYPRF